MAAEPTLFDEASLALIASGGAGKDGVVYSVKPVPVYGSELIANGDFATDSGWTKSSATISGGTGNLNGTGVTSLLYQPILVGNKPYKANFTVSNYNGVGQAAVVDSDGNILYTITGNENKTIYFTQSAAANSNFFFRAINNAIYSVDDVSVQEVISDNGDFTFSRGSNLSATRVNASQLIEKGRENLLLQSNQFDTTWALQSATALTSGQSGYDGSNNAWLLTKTAASSFRYLYQSISLSGAQTFSVYAKASSLNMVTLYLNAPSNYYVKFRLVDGSVAEQSPGIINTNAEDVGNGWWRVSVTISNSITRVRIYPDFQETTAGSILIQDAQLEQGLVATPYIETGALTAQAGILEDTPRFDYSGGATCPSLLLEPSRTNLITQSEYIGNYINYGSTDTANSATSPQGVNNATLIEGNGTQTQIYTGTPDITVSSAGLYTLSIFAKKGTNNYLKLFLDGFAGSSNNGASFDLLNVSTPTSGASIKDYGNGWYRCSITATIDAGDLVGKLAFNVAESDSNVFFNSASDANGKNIYIYGLQLEAGSYPTSYIPTYGVSQTRAVEICGDAGDASTFNDNEGVLYAEIAALANDGTYRIFSLNDGTRNERVYIQYKPNTNEISGVVKNGNNTQANIGYVLSDETQYAKIAFKWKENDFAFWVNGVERGTDTSGSVPVGLSNLALDQGNDNNYLFGKVKQVLVFKEALSDTELIKLTTI